MKQFSINLGLLSLIFVLTPLLSSAQPLTVAPRLVMEQHSFDAGSAKEGTRVLHDFRFMNGGDTTLEILKVVPG